MNGKGAITVTEQDGNCEAGLTRSCGALLNPSPALQKLRDITGVDGLPQRPRSLLAHSRDLIADELSFFTEAVACHHGVSIVITREDPISKGLHVLDRVWLLDASHLIVELLANEFSKLVVEDAQMRRVRVQNGFQDISVHFIEPDVLSDLRIRMRRGN